MRLNQISLVCHKSPHTQSFASFAKKKFSTMIAMKLVTKLSVHATAYALRAGHRR